MLQLEINQYTTWHWYHDQNSPSERDRAGPDPNQAWGHITSVRVSLMLYRRDMGVILHLGSDGVMQHAAVILEQDSATYRIEKVPDGALRGGRA